MEARSAGSNPATLTKRNKVDILRIKVKLHDTNKFGIGKYKDRFIKEVMKFDSQYVIWAHKNGIIKLNGRMKDIATKRAYQEYVEWLEEYCGGEVCITY